MCVCLYICMYVLSQDTFWTPHTNRFFEIRSKSAGPALPFELAHGNTLKVICVLLIYRTVAQKPLPLDPFSPLSPFSFPVAPTEPLAQMNNVGWWPLNLSKENSALWQSSLLPIFQFKPLSSDYANMKPWNNCYAEKDWRLQGLVVTLWHLHYSRGDKLWIQLLKAIMDLVYPHSLSKNELNDFSC